MKIFDEFKLDVLSAILYVYIVFKPVAYNLGDGGLTSPKATIHKACFKNIPMVMI